MKITDLLSTEAIQLNGVAKSKEEVIDKMVELMTNNGNIINKEEYKRIVKEREKEGTTGIGEEIAIPHGKTDTVSDLVACIGVSDNPVDFDSLDQEPCRIFIMTLSPVNKTGPHLQFLAEVSLLFKSADKRAQILNTQDKAEVIKILTE